MNTTSEILLGAAVGAAAAVALPRGEDTHTPAAPLDVAGRAVVVTSSTLPSWASAVMGAGTGVAGLRALRTRTTGGLVAAASMVALAVGVRRVGVVVGAHGVTLTCGLPGVRGTIPVSSIRSARAVTVTAAEFGGLGIRWSAERGLGLVLRSGPALTLDLGTFSLTITVDDAEVAAALVAREVEAHKASAS